MKQINDNNYLSFNLQWSKGGSLTRVSSVEIILFFNYDYNGEKAFGIASANIIGHNIAECSIVGDLIIESGTAFNSTTQNQLHSYNIASIQQQMVQSKSYLSFQYSALPINMQNDLLSLNILMNYGLFNNENSNASILGQLVWSWIQYFPLFLTFYWICDKCIRFLLQQNIILRKKNDDIKLIDIIKRKVTVKNKK